MKSSANSNSASSSHLTYPIFLTVAPNCVSSRRLPHGRHAAPAPHGPHDARVPSGGGARPAPARGSSAGRPATHAPSPPARRRPPRPPSPTASTACPARRPRPQYTGKANRARTNGHPWSPSRFAASRGVPRCRPSASTPGSSSAGLTARAGTHPALKADPDHPAKKQRLASRPGNGGSGGGSGHSVSGGRLGRECLVLFPCPSAPTRTPTPRFISMRTATKTTTDGPPGHPRRPPRPGA
jgi:hypothetical protein